MQGGNQMYQGYLVKIDGHVISNDLIRAETYATKVNTQDLDSFTDANGVLHRNVVEHTAIKCEWNMPVCDQTKMQSMLGILRSIWGESAERKATCEVYVPEWDRYYTGTFYMPDYQLKMLQATNTQIVYAETRFALIEY